MEQLPYSTLVPGEVADSGNAKYWIITCCSRDDVIKVGFGE